MSTETILQPSVKDAALDGPTALPKRLMTDIICISSIDWDFMWQTHQEIMSRLAAQGDRVLFIENTGTRLPRLSDLPRVLDRLKNWRRGVCGIRQERESLFVFSPLVIPIPHSCVAARLNQWFLLFVLRRWMKAMGFGQPIIWTFLPTRLTIDLINEIDHRLLIYYCADRFTAVSAETKKIERSEVELLRRADLVFVTSQALARHCGQFASKVYCFPAGVDLGMFNLENASPAPQELRGLRQPVIGYVGGIHQWLDLELLRTIALKRVEYSFVLVGPVQTDASLLQGLPNVKLVGERPHHELPNYIRQFDVGIIPYRVTDYTQHVYPSKLNEYLAMGKPVVSTALPEIQSFNQRFGSLVHIGQDAAGFDEALERALLDRNETIAHECYRAACANDWETRVQQLSGIIREAVQQKWDRREQQWLQVFAQLVRTSRRRLTKVFLSALIGYLILFHTPALWWLAQPLWLKDTPVHADAIAVFAGGVGESGQAGQGYQERVEHAVSLYRQGFAPLLLFSSGYRYTFKEAEVMKVLAESLGVPATAIILEELAGNTRENVRLSAALLRSQGCHSVLVVSSPYHMRRVSLVWRKEAPDISTTWTPIPYSHFFGDHSQVKLRHVQAIAHEYLGILYYWWKGWM